MLHIASSEHPWTQSSASANKRWRQRFEAMRGRHRGLALTRRPELSPKAESALLRSVAVFQLGLSGDGVHLLACAERSADDDYVRATELFIAEEQNHAALLAQILGVFDQPLLERHWTHRVFRTLRRGSGLRNELLVLLLAEIVGAKYYEALRDGLDDAGLARVFGAIAADEERHLDFHGETLNQFLSEWPSPNFWTARITWNVAIRGASVVAAITHRHILRECGVSVRQFATACVSAAREQEPRLFRHSTHRAPLAGWVVG